MNKLLQRSWQFLKTPVSTHIVNFLHNLKDFFSSPSPSRVYAIIGLAILVMALPVTIVVLQQRTNFLQQAASGCPNGLSSCCQSYGGLCLSSSLCNAEGFHCVNPAPYGGGCNSGQVCGFSNPPPTPNPSGGGGSCNQYDAGQVCCTGNGSQCKQATQMQVCEKYINYKYSCSNTYYGGCHTIYGQCGTPLPTLHFDCLNYNTKTYTRKLPGEDASTPNNGVYKTDDALTPSNTSFVGDCATDEFCAGPGATVQDVCHKVTSVDCSCESPNNPKDTKFSCGYNVVRSCGSGMVCNNTQDPGGHTQVGLWPCIKAASGCDPTTVPYICLNSPVGGGYFLNPSNNNNKIPLRVALEPGGNYYYDFQIFIYTVYKNTSERPPQTYSDGSINCGPHNKNCPQSSECIYATTDKGPYYTYMFPIKNPQDGETVYWDVLYYHDANCSQPYYVHAPFALGGNYAASTGSFVIRMPSTTTPTPSPSPTQCGSEGQPCCASDTSQCNDSSLLCNAQNNTCEKKSGGGGGGGGSCSKPGYYKECTWAGSGCNTYLGHIPVGHEAGVHTCNGVATSCDDLGPCSSGGGTPTPPPSCSNGQDTKITLSLKLDGIGTGSFENNTPKHPSRTGTVSMVDTANNTNSSVNGSTQTFTYGTDGNFDSTTIDLGTGLSCGGLYKVAVKLPGYLSTTADVTYGNTSQVISLEPIGGDINQVDNNGVIIGDGKIDINDYSIYRQCLNQDPTTPITFQSNTKAITLTCGDLINFFDFQDGGTLESTLTSSGIGEWDANYNLWLRWFIKANGY